MDQIFHKYVRDKQFVGIGTGHTMEIFSKYLPSNKTYIPTSVQTQMFLKNQNIMPAMNQNKIDIYFDSADYYNDRGDLIKGGGGALTPEKLFSKMASQTVIIVNKNKFIKHFEQLFVPIEIIKQSYGYLTSIIEERGLLYNLRKINDTIPFITDLGNIIIDVEFDKEFLSKCKNITGVIEHGYFENEGNFMIEEIIEDDE